MSKSELKRRAIQAGMRWDPLLLDIAHLRHAPAERALVVDDAFTRWTRTLDAKHWARYDLSACALGWNAAIDAACALIAGGDQGHVAQGSGAGQGDAQDKADPAAVST